MSITTKKCNFCHSELRVSDEAQVVECPVCGCINGYGYSRSNQNEKYSKGAPGNKITGVMPNIQNHQQQPFSAAPNQGQAQLHVLLGGTKQPGSLHFVDTNCLFQQTPQASVPGYSPPLAKTTSFLQPPPQVSQSSQVSFRTLKTNYTSFQQLSQKSLSLQSSLPPVKTKPPFQLSSQTSSPPIPERIINNFFQQPQKTSSPQGSPRPSYNNISYQQPFQISSPPDQDEVNDYSWQPQKTQTSQGSPRPLYTNIPHPQPFQTSSPPGQDKFNGYSWQPQKTQTPQGSPRPLYTNISHPQPFQTSSPPGQDKSNEYSWQPQKSPSAQGSPRPYNNTPYQQPLISSPPTEYTNNSSENPQETLSPQRSPHPAYNNSTYQPLQTVSPLIPEKANTTFQLPQRTSSPQWPSRSAYSTNSHEQPLQTSQPPVQEKTENFSQLAPQASPQPVQEKISSISEQPQQSSPKGPPNSSYVNTSNQQPIQSSPHESAHQPQTSLPQGSSPRPSRFSSFLRPRAAQIPPQASSPLAHDDDYSQKLSQPSSQISSPPAKEDNNGHNQISTPPSSEAAIGFSKKPLLATAQMSASQGKPLLQAPRTPVNNNGQNYQKTVPDTRPVSSSNSTNLQPPTANSQSADNQNSRNTQAFRGNLSAAPANYINKSVADADDDPHYTKRRLQEFREQLQI
ncbi:hypothetical protein DCAR_0933608 [Daucus carota subsp. sativus]|uniref:Uncharacterized protein n=1 Tax=Daucus carota subsp. sativus TaxID=79200 RepID=A0A175YE76_DAUCS|nr:PREDICTED: proline-rich extensin-like protein EPR1 [Daucus carota subsp. sativus]WOH14092.1 hypothetical protein DCAR_0933608 [Daucus carota subsp. sativus]